ncbi:MAG TPA: DinB family protein [Candidatus Limnocylindria bacterium]
MSQAPSSGELQAFEPARVAELLHASQMLVVGELAALGEDGGWHPAGGEWCAREVVGHLIEAERRGFAGRIRAMIDEHRPTFEPWDQAATEVERHDCDKESRALVDEFVTLRRESVGMVKKLDAAALRRPCDGRRAVRPRPAPRVGAPRPEPHQAAAVDLDGAGLAPHGERAEVPGRLTGIPGEQGAAPPGRRSSAAEQGA